MPCPQNNPMTRREILKRAALGFGSVALMEAAARSMASGEVEDVVVPEI